MGGERVAGNEKQIYEKGAGGGGACSAQAELYFCSFTGKRVAVCWGERAALTEKHTW